MKHPHNDRIYFTNLSCRQTHYPLEQGATISIWTDYKECKQYEGKAILIKQVDPCGDSFYLENEKLLPDETKEEGQPEEDRLSTYKSLDKFLKSTVFPMPRLVKQLSKHKSGDSYLKRLQLLERYSELKTCQAGSIVYDMLSKHTYSEIIRYIEQLDPNWQATIYTSEKWLVKFTEDSMGWPIDFTTTRRLRRNTMTRKNKTYVERNTTYSARHKSNNMVDEHLLPPHYYHPLLSDRQYKF